MSPTSKRNDVKNTPLHSAKSAKNDEFYTQMADIERELRHYKEQFRDKVVFCNCDDPYKSSFFKYFALNFNFLGLKKVIATCYAGSPIANIQLSLFDHEPIEDITTRVPHGIEIVEVEDYKGDTSVAPADVEYLLRNKKNVITRLKGNGDFRSPECVEFLKQADIVVTNPPFSLFREYVAQLMEYEKKFLIIGSMNAITYKEIFKIIKDNKMWVGYGFAGGNAYFKVLPENADYAAGVYDPETSTVKFRNVHWFTNLETSKRYEKMTLFKTYKRKDYPKYDNYDAIEVSKLAIIPVDYEGVMGVPITFLDKYNPNQFEILGLDDHRLIYPEWRGRGPDLNGKPVYRRIIIRKKPK